eukprot:CAMPEP_0175691336 /NCGR_PEP_ID=MMETSP0097-20121207/30346_1 /TAXON_ID=311494 /ORGANISM="Alexandrium monilatum, Strain CCMP3105" /LENGTH=239 /DNA_ID=CAMNT_0016998385 /DNA_START=89 /DNA_END=806 /DNA_ORIENTATION=-
MEACRRDIPSPGEAAPPADGDLGQAAPENRAGGRAAAVQRRERQARPPSRPSKEPERISTRAGAAALARGAAPLSHGRAAARDPRSPVRSHAIGRRGRRVLVCEPVQAQQDHVNREEAKAAPRQASIHRPRGAEPRRRDHVAGGSGGRGAEDGHVAGAQLLPAAAAPPIANDILVFDPGGHRAGLLRQAQRLAESPAWKQGAAGRKCHATLHLPVPECRMTAHDEQLLPRVCALADALE